MRLERIVEKHTVQIDNVGVGYTDYEFPVRNRGILRGVNAQLSSGTGTQVAVRVRDNGDDLIYQHALAAIVADMSLSTGFEAPSFGDGLKFQVAVDAGSDTTVILTFYVEH